ncbi:TIM barrel protein [Aeromicrobium wangtongii]|uniref:TIM barrel protein n=1 Tax=Aeromicrobium wangtongii TaxID=2969247 RepID=A0ABY5MCM7_9ACTN|nr:TIM barrel protein [Aeromicrobium wangtongii]MCD9197244.1 TIM barrel protein [Aeromicrobium wangtongii]UUP14740.1 TIM barrel protein [Aeromicrobium wangtongii]
MSAERVLTEMQSLGLTATEFGPDGFLPGDPSAKAAFLDGFGLHAVGGFLPVLLHDPGHDPFPEVDRFVDACLASGAGVVVLAASTGAEGYDARPVLDDQQWTTLLGNLDRIAEHATSRGVVAAIHPHIGTVVENADDVQRVLEGSHVGLCVDTGHLTAAGADPVALTLANLSRVEHVHLKDVDAATAARVVSGELAFTDAVAAGMWRVLGQGDVDVRAMIDALRSHGYSGWFVLEQDVMFTDGAPTGEGPVADVRACLDFVKAALA